MKKREKLKKVTIVLMIVILLGLVFISYKIGFNAGYGQAKYDYIYNNFINR